MNERLEQPIYQNLNVTIRKLNSDSLENQDIKDFFNDTISYEDEIKDIKIIIFAIIILLIRIISIIILFKKYNKFAILHTYTNKLTGLMLFFIPFLYIWIIQI